MSEADLAAVCRGTFADLDPEEVAAVRAAIADLRLPAPPAVPAPMPWRVYVLLGALVGSVLWVALA